MKTQIKALLTQLGERNRPEIMKQVSAETLSLLVLQANEQVLAEVYLSLAAKIRWLSDEALDRIKPCLVKNLDAVLLRIPKNKEHKKILHSLITDYEQNLSKRFVQAKSLEKISIFKECRRHSITLTSEVLKKININFYQKNWIQLIQAIDSVETGLLVTEAMNNHLPVLSNYSTFIGAKVAALKTAKLIIERNQSIPLLESLAADQNKYAVIRKECDFDAMIAAALLDQLVGMTQ